MSMQHMFEQLEALNLLSPSSTNFAGVVSSFSSITCREAWSREAAEVSSTTAAMPSRYFERGSCASPANDTPA